MSCNNNNNNNNNISAHGVDAAEVANAKNTIDFLTMARGLKTTPRTGWVLQKAGPRIESVADHSWRISLMAMVASSPSISSSASSSTSSITQQYDTNRCIKMALVHDLAEATVGDITPHCGVSDNTKHELELRAITEMTQKLTIGLLSTVDDVSSSSSSSNIGVGNEILELWKEYEEGVTDNAKLVKDMDKLEMILQALEYENDGKNEKSLDG
jgi:putative hydrolase of HD superfamily